MARKGQKSNDGQSAAGLSAPQPLESNTPELWPAIKKPGNGVDEPVDDDFVWYDVVLMFDCTGAGLASRRYTFKRSSTVY